MKILTKSIIAGSLLFGFSSFAQVPCGEGPTCVAPTMQSGFTSNTKSQIYIGLIWDIAEKFSEPKYIIGYRNAKIDSSADVTGQDFNFRFTKKGDGFSVDSLRIMGLFGTNQWMGTLGGGYSFQNNSVLGTIGVQSSIFRGSYDYIVSQGLNKFFIEANTLSELKRPISGGSQCPGGFFPVQAMPDTDTSGVYAGNNYTINTSSSQISGGITCVNLNAN